MLPLLLLWSASAAAQMDPYESRYGSAVDVAIDDLIQMPESYLNKAVRTRGELELLPSTGRLRFTLRGRFMGRITLQPLSEAAYDFETNARQWLGKEVEVTGIFGSGTDPDTGQLMYMIGLWAFLGPPDDKVLRGPVTETTLEELVTKPGKLDGKMVRVRGEFRGQNLFGDLPASSRRRTSDWVMREELFAVWVTGRKPRGSGWSLDAGLKRDTGKWLEVTGRVSTARGVVTLEALEVVLAKGPKASPSAQAAREAQPPAPPSPPRPPKPPMVVFSLPLDGERDVPFGTVFRIQFSKDMDESSLKGRVVVRYAGRPQPGDRDLDAVRFSYDGGLRTLDADPGDLLRPGRVVEVLLLPGIVDVDGLPLEPRPGAKPGPATDVLRFQIAPAGLLGGVSR
jgi:hypothetical protein